MCCGLGNVEACNSDATALTFYGPRNFDQPVTILPQLKPVIQVNCVGDVEGGVPMKHRIVVAFLATSFTAGVASAADWPVSAPQFYGAGRVIPVEWTGLYFGVNAGYGWAQSSSNIVFGGGLTGGTTTPSGGGATELGGKT